MLSGLLGISIERSKDRKALINDVVIARNSEEEVINRSNNINF